MGVLSNSCPVDAVVERLQGTEYNMHIMSLAVGSFTHKHGQLMWPSSVVIVANVHSSSLLEIQFIKLL